MPFALIHYHEVALKGRNRHFFEQRLVQHLHSSLRHHGVTHVESLPGRIRATFHGESCWESIRDGIQHTFGVANFSRAWAVPLDFTAPDLTTLGHLIEHEIATLPFQTFRITTKRADKRFPMTSLEVNREVGAHLCRQTGKHVSLGNPDLNIFIELVNREAYFSLVREPGPGGLPVGVSGKVLCLLSGGIDSPVAAYRMMKRGCKVAFVHFHGRPYLSRASEEKVRELVEFLTRYQLYSRLHLIPFGEIQRQIVLDAPAPFRIVLYRRMMMRIAEELAKREQSWALVTGDSLGQVASQTPENLQVVNEVPQMLTLRPLIGMDKQEIIDQARQIGTFETSIEPDQDCCTLFVPPHPSTKSRLDQIQKAEQRLDISFMVKQGLERGELVEFTLNEKTKMGSNC